MKICHRHFRRRRQEKLIPSGSVRFKPVHVRFKFWQLGRPDHAIAADQKWWTNLEIPVLACMQIEHELDEGTLQPRADARETDESAATEFRCALQIEQLQSGSDSNVIECIANFRFFPPLAHQ